MEEIELTEVRYIHSRDTSINPFELIMKDRSVK
jgi:hypothetical protein